MTAQNARKQPTAIFGLLKTSVHHANQRPIAFETLKSKS
jgi:hypothetical protein